MESYPKVTAVEAIEGKRLRVTFDNGRIKFSDCRPLLAKLPFRALENDGLFRAVRPDAHGYALIWNDDLDLAESELWINGADA
jgi:hypothetical protein